MAHARGGDVQWSVTIGAPIYVPAPVYRQPAPVYHQPPPVYYPHARYQQPTHWDRDGDGILFGGPSFDYGRSRVWREC